jgi:chromatin remodeling complex protein RSC6
VQLRHDPKREAVDSGQLDLVQAWGWPKSREILADDKLRRVFGKDKVTMFEMNKHLAGHLK